MLRTKLVAASVAALALAARPLIAAPAAAQPVDLPCDAFRPPFDHPCNTAEETLVFVEGQVNDTIDFVFAVRDEVGEVAFRVFCTAFPDHPACQA